MLMVNPAPPTRAGNIQLAYVVVVSCAGLFIELAGPLLREFPLGPKQDFVFRGEQGTEPRGAC